MNTGGKNNKNFATEVNPILLRSQAHILECAIMRGTITLMPFNRFIGCDWMFVTQVDAALTKLKGRKGYQGPILEE